MLIKKNISNTGKAYHTGSKLLDQELVISDLEHDVSTKHQTPCSMSNLVTHASVVSPVVCGVATSGNAVSEVYKGGNAVSVEALRCNCGASTTQMQFMRCSVYKTRAQPTARG